MYECIKCTNTSWLILKLKAGVKMNSSNHLNIIYSSQQIISGKAKTSKLKCLALDEECKASLP